MVKVALFDFCETLVKFQTADRYVQYVCRHIDSKSIRCRTRVYNCCRKTHLLRILSVLFSHSSVNKRLILWRLRGLERTELEHFAEGYYRDLIKPNLIPEAVSELMRLQGLGYRIIILSGGYNLYLKCFADEFGITDVVSSVIDFKKEVCTGRIKGKDCLWEHKIEMLEEYCRQNQIEIDRKESFAFSDSESDLPMLEYVGKRIIVHRKDRKKWYSKIDYYKEIIWDA